MRPDRVVLHRPIHGFDTMEVGRFVAALESESKPATLEWRGSNSARIRAVLAPGEIVATQINYHPGWQAIVKGSIATVRPDGIGLMVVHANCTGDCEITLEYDGGRELRLCRAASGGVLLMFVAVGWFQRRSRAVT
jgi:hypothetical protein